MSGWRGGAGGAGGAGVVLVALLASDAGAQRPFEGVVTMRFAGLAAPNGASATGAAPAGTASREIEYLISGQRIRVNMAGMPGGMTMLMLPAEKKSVMLMPAQNAYMEVPMAQTEAALADVRAKAAAQLPTDTKVTPTGKTEVIAGYRCEHVKISSTDKAGTTQTVDACISKELGGSNNPLAALTSGPMGSMLGTSDPAWQKALNGQQGFTLRLTGPDGRPVFEVTKVEKKRLANTLFSIPDNYTKMAAPTRR